MAVLPQVAKFIGQAVHHQQAEATRRALVERLAKGPATVSELAAPLPMSLPAVMGHLKVLELSGPQLRPVRLFLNDQMLVVKQGYETAGPDGRPVRAEEAFSDYQTVEGIRIPFKATLLRDGRPILDRILTRVTLNGPIDEKLFARP